jgi:hypothetical protein
MCQTFREAHHIYGWGTTAQHAFIVHLFVARGIKNIRRKKTAAQCSGFTESFSAIKV